MVSQRPRVESPHRPLWIAPLRLALDHKGLAADRELIVVARARDLARPQLERRSLSMNTGVAESDDRVRTPGDELHRHRLAPGRV
jgi:hypothetical protein